MKGPDHTVAGRYRLLAQLGRGGMGVVWRATDARLGRDVALKVLHPWVADDPELRDRFEREASALARLEHPNVVRLYDVLESGGQTVLVMELIDGVGLDTLVSGRAVGWDEARRLCAPVAAALAHAHARGVVHRDLTPANVLVEHGSGRVVVTDFGLARLARSTRTAPISGVLAGTPEYWAPEQAAGEATGPATDLYALGCILFRLLAGRVPFEGEDRLATGLRRAYEPAPSLGDVAHETPQEAVRIVARLLERAPERRGTAADVAIALGAEPDTLPHTVSRPRRAAKPHDARPAPTTIVTALLREPATVVQRVRSHRSFHRARVRLAAALVLSVVALAGGAVYAVAGGDPSGIDAPDVVGLQVSAARAELTARAREDDLQAPRLKIVDRSYSESAPAGAIVAQDPPSGERIPERGSLLVSVSLGSAYAEVPSVTGLAGAAAVALLERNGFTPTRRYAPSTEIEAWHALDTEPTTGERVKRPARVVLVISTGPPKRPVPALDGLDGAGVEQRLRDAGFEPALEERASQSVEPGTVLSVTPKPGARVPLGSAIKVVVARAPRWEAVSQVESTEDADGQVMAVPAQTRLVLVTDDTSPLELFGGKIEVEWSGDESGKTKLRAGEAIVLLDATDHDRTVSVRVDVDGATHWRLAVEAWR